MEKLIKDTQRHLCCYFSDGKEGMTSFCDCKYGADNVGGSGEKGNGCPEMRFVYALIKEMTEREYNTIIRRTYKDIGTSCQNEKPHNGNTNEFGGFLLSKK